MYPHVAKTRIWIDIRERYFKGRFYFQMELKMCRQSSRMGNKVEKKVINSITHDVDMAGMAIGCYESISTSIHHIICITQMIMQGKKLHSGY